MDDPLSLQQTLEFVFARADAMQTFWNLYIVVVTAILGFLGSSKLAWRTHIVPTVLTIGFLLFAASNFWALDSARRQREGLIAHAETQLVPNEGADLGRVLGAVAPPSESLLRLFHAALDLAVLAAIWLIPFVRRTSDSRGSDEEARI